METQQFFPRKLVTFFIMQIFRASVSFQFYINTHVEDTKFFEQLLRAYLIFLINFKPLVQVKLQIHSTNKMQNDTMLRNRHSYRQVAESFLQFCWFAMTLLDFQEISKNVLAWFGLMFSASCCLPVSSNNISASCFEKYFLKYFHVSDIVFCASTWYFDGVRLTICLQGPAWNSHL